LSAAHRGSSTVDILDSDVLLPSLDPSLLVEALREGHRNGVDSVERLLLSEPIGAAEANHFLLLPAWRHGSALGAKLVTVFPGNESSGRGPNIRSVYLLFDGADGRPLRLITGESFTRYKTAADSALAATFLARPDVKALTVIGAGAQAEAQIRVMCAARPSIDTVLVWNRTPAKAASLAARLTLSGASVSAVDDLAAAVGQADIVSCVTSASQPVLHGAWLRAGAHVDLVGSFTPDMRESDDETVRRSRIYVDTRRFTLRQSGDLADPLSRGLIAETDVITDLFELCAGQASGRASDAEITLFKNGGGGHLDLMVAQFLHRSADGSAAPVPQPEPA
jgi:ornithine cyclodeaminase